jgi:hypothetical protein
MTEPTVHQAPEGIAARAIWLVAVGVVVISAALVAVAWLLVVPPPAATRAVSAPSSLEHGLIDQAAGGDEARTAGEQALENYDWIDRHARVVRIPIERAIDAVVLDPRLIGAPSPGLAGAGAPPGAGAPR